MNRFEDNQGPQCCGLFVSIGPEFDYDELKGRMREFGKLQKFIIPKNTDKNGKKWPKGYGFVYYSKASEAAAALEAMNGIKFGPQDKTMFVSVLDARKEDGKEILPTLICVRYRDKRSLDDVRSEFEKFGDIKKVYYHKGETIVNVDFEKFSGAAAAVENCPKNLNPYFVLPTPKKGLKRPFPGDDFPGGMGMGDMMGMGMGMGMGEMMGNGMGMGMMNPPERGFGMGADRGGISDSMSAFQSGMNVAGQSGKEGKVKVIFNPSIKKTALTKIFNIVPGFISADLQEMTERGAVAVVKYDNPASAEHAADRIDQLEYPPGSFLEVKLDRGIDINSVDSSWSSDPFMLMPEADAQKECSIKLPPVQPLASEDAPIVKRLFFVVVNCYTLPPNALITNLFSRFGNLANAICLRGKRCGYARYCSEKSADTAMRVLNGCRFMGSTLKVEEDKGGKQRE